jgi:hypothetical protein
MRWLAVVLMIASLTQADATRAQSPGTTNSALQFTEAERAVIARNVMLRSVVEQEPALVRRVLDALAATDVQTRSALVGGKPPATAPAQPNPSAEPSENPDLDRLERSSPEAVNDLFQLLKQAARSRPQPSR